MGHPVGTNNKKQNEGTRVINLADAPGEKATWDRPKAQVYLWSIVELLLVTNPWQISSSLRVRALKLFGAEIGRNVIFRPRTRVKFPWKLHVGDRSWIGEGVWLHNQDHIHIGSDVVISQETFLTTGSHAHRTNMELRTRPIKIQNGVWITSRCMILGGVTLGTSSLVKPMSLVQDDVSSNTVVGGNPARPVGARFTDHRVAPTRTENL
jgi:putative colanic acid biosynthesis acetyltransferase WcaF